MKLCVTTLDQLCMYRPGVADPEEIFEVPDALAETVFGAVHTLQEAHRDVLSHLVATGQVRPGSGLYEYYRDMEDVD